MSGGQMVASERVGDSISGIRGSGPSASQIDNAGHGHRSFDGVDPHVHGVDRGRQAVCERGLANSGEAGKDDQRRSGFPRGHAPDGRGLPLNCADPLRLSHVAMYSEIYIAREGALMALTSVDLDPRLLERARERTGERSDRAVLDLALRRLIASKQKGAMIDGILELTELPGELDSPVVSYPDSTW